MNKKRAILTIAGMILALMLVGNPAANGADNTFVKGAAGLDSPDIQQDKEAAHLNAYIKDCTRNDETEGKLEACIDKALDDCVDTFQSTAGQVACLRTATARWEEKMKAAFEELSAKMNADQEKALEKAQENWEKSVESDIDLLASIHGPGTMYIPMRGYRRYELVKARTEVLRGYLEMSGDGWNQ